MEDAEGPGFSYTVGLFQTYRHPEVIIIGLRQQLCHILLNNIREDIKNGTRFQTGSFYPGVLDDFQCVMLEVPARHFKEYAGYALWYYVNAKFPLLQCLYPTVQGIFPWEKEWPEDIQNLQPVLGDVNQIRF